MSDFVVKIEDIIPDLRYFILLSCENMYNFDDGILRVWVMS
jgi:hypothetical protein